MKKINKKDLITYTVLAIITCIIFIPLLVGHYASDSYNIYNIGYHDYAIKYSLNDGRIFMSVLGLIANKINIPLNIYISITLFLALLISNVAVMVLSKIIKKYKEPKNIFQEIVVIIISYITIFNFMYLENLYFVESIVMAVSILLLIISANVVVEKNKQYFIKSVILTILAIMFYQGTIGLFFAYVLLFTILKNNNNIKQIIFDFLQSGIVGAVGVLTNLLIIKVIGYIFNMSQSRYGSLANIPRNMIYILGEMPKIMQQTFGLFPKNALIIFLSILTVIAYIYQLKNINKEDNTISKYIVIVLITIASAYIIHLTTLTGWSGARLKNSLGALIGIIFIFLYAGTDIFQNKDKLNTFTSVTLLAFTIINVVNYEYIILQHKKVNILEKEEVQKLDEYISNYEEDTGIKVTKIAKVVIIGKQSKGYFSGIKNRTAYTHNSMRVYWSTEGIINFYTQRNLENVTITKSQKEFYEQNEDEQIGYKCIDDTLYISDYIY